jgi:putative endonuclease
VRNERGEGSVPVRTLPQKTFHVYIVTNCNKTLYIGVTNSLLHRVRQHKDREGSAFTAKYGLDKLVYAEEFTSIIDAIAREKQLKGWTRVKKVALIEESNPNWVDLYMV